MFKITMDSKQVRLMSDWVGKLDGIIRDPRTVSAGVRPLGLAIKRNFRTEGSATGRRWQPLTAFTQQTREQRGYSPAHPILRQSGGLESVTADALASYLTATSAMVRSTDGANMVAASTSLNFQASASGKKVQNHFGGSGDKGQSERGRGTIPARPFFGFTEDDAQKSADAIMKRIMTDWGSRSSTVRRTG